LRRLRRWAQLTSLLIVFTSRSRHRPAISCRLVQFGTSFSSPIFSSHAIWSAIFRSSCSRSCIVSPLVYSSSCEHVNCRTAAAAANPRCFICVQSCLHRQTQEILISKILEISKARRTNHWKSKYCRTAFVQPLSFLSYELARDGVQFVSVQASYSHPKCIRTTHLQCFLSMG